MWFKKKKEEIDFITFLNASYIELNYEEIKKLDCNNWIENGCIDYSIDGFLFYYHRGFFVCDELKMYFSEDLSNEYLKNEYKESIEKVKNKILNK